TRIFPDQPASAAIKSENLLRPRAIHDSVSNERRGLQAEPTQVVSEIRSIRIKLLPQRHRVNPSEGQLIYIRGVDLVEFAVTVPAQLAVVSEPVSGMRVENLREGNFIGTAGPCDAS